MCLICLSVLYFACTLLNFTVKGVGLLSFISRAPYLLNFTMKELGDGGGDSDGEIDDDDDDADDDYLHK